MNSLSTFKYIIQDDDGKIMCTAPLLQQAGGNLNLLEIKKTFRVSKIDIEKLEVHGYTIGSIEP